MMFKKLLTLDEAQKIVRQHVSPKPLAFEEIPLSRALNRVLAQNIVAPLNIPPFDRSTVDGYAVNAEDTFGAEENKPTKLKICGRANVGEMPRAIVKLGTAVEIVTGAPVPQGANAVVMFEDTELEGDELHVHSAVVGGENVMKAGSDVKKGQMVLTKGTMLGSGEIGTLAAVGLSKIEVHCVPRVAVLSTGAEVTKPGRKLLPGKIYDTNAYSLGAAVEESGGKPIYMGVLADKAAEIRGALVEALRSADLVVTSGGVSVGPKDLMPQVLDSFGKQCVLIHGVEIKPGKPVTIASINGKMVFSLPGHPASALLVFHLFVKPVIQTMAGRKPDQPLKVKAIATMKMFPAKGRRTFIMVRLRKDKTGRLLAEPVPTGLSGAITTVAKADGFVEIAENKQFIDADEEVKVTLLKAAPITRLE
ncbi:MAG: gephyrin-like molybdotransferase Glp [Candidatus Bathyarchaeia archaeon]|jgi:molybdenum cofactor synthesis domain-containing protein